MVPVCPGGPEVPQKPRPGATSVGSGAKSGQRTNNPSSGNSVRPSVEVESSIVVTVTDPVLAVLGLPCEEHIECEPVFLVRPTLTTADWQVVSIGPSRVVSGASCLGWIAIYGASGVTEHVEPAIACSPIIVCSAERCLCSRILLLSAVGFCLVSFAWCL